MTVTKQSLSGADGRHVNSIKKGATQTNLSGDHGHGIVNTALLDLQDQITVQGRDIEMLKAALAAGGGGNGVPIGGGGGVPPVTVPPPGALDASTFPTVIAAAIDGSTYVFGPGTSSPSSPVTLHASGVEIDTAPSFATVVHKIGRPDVIFIKADAHGARVNGLCITPDLSWYMPAGDGDGSGLFNLNGRPSTENGLGPLDDVIVDGLSLTLPPQANASQQGLYFSGKVTNVTIRNLKSNGGGSRGAGFHGYHTSSAGACDNIVLDTGVFTDHPNQPVIFWLPCTTLTIKNVDFIRCGAVRFATGGDVYLQNCRGQHAPTIDSAGSSGVPGTTVIHETGNNWSWTP